MKPDKNKGYAPVRIRETTLDKLKALRDRMAARENAARERQGALPRQHPLSVNDVIESLLYRLAKEQARQDDYQARRRGKK